MKLHRAYRYRLEPNAAQTERLYQFSGARRFVYNWALGKRIEIYKETGKGLSYVTQNLALTQLKKQPELEWLKEADSQSLQESLRDVERAYKNFFGHRARFPRFKSKNSGCFAFRIPQRVKVEGNQVYCPKIGWIKLRLSQLTEGKTKSATFKRDAAGHWFVTLLTEFEMPDTALPEPKNSVGVDLGLKDFVYLSNGESVKAPKFFRKSAKKLKKVQRVLSRCKKGSQRRKKAKTKVALTHRKVANQRADFIHKQTTALVKKYDAICIEDLNVKGMSKNHRLAKSIMDVAFREFRRQVEYKCLWHRKHFLVIDRWFPSSKTCGDCGETNKGLKLSDRNWLCSCGTFHNRDHNAAKNILDEGLRILAVGHTDNKNARGATVRPAIAGALL